VIKVYQLLVHGRWFSPGIPASSTTKTGRHDITETNVALALSNNHPLIHFTVKHVYKGYTREHENVILSQPLLMNRMHIENV
jgi:hypothetical protein